MYESGEAFSGSGAVFSTQLIDVYVRTLGSWARPVITLTALTAMLSTTLAIIDGYPRVIDRLTKAVRSGDPEVTAGSPVSGPYWASMVGIGCLTVIFLWLFAGSLTQMVDFVTTVAFLTGPVLSYLNLRVMTSPQVPAEHRAWPLDAGVGARGRGGTGAGGAGLSRRSRVLSRRVVGWPASGRPGPTVTGVPSMKKTFFAFRCPHCGFGF